MSKAATKALIDEKITGNGVQAITGPILNNVLNTMVDDYGTQEEVSQLGQEVVKNEDTLCGNHELVNIVRELYLPGVNLASVVKIRFIFASSQGGKYINIIRLLDVNNDRVVDLWVNSNNSVADAATSWVGTKIVSDSGLYGVVYLDDIFNNYTTAGQLKDYPVSLSPSCQYLTGNPCISALLAFQNLDYSVPTITKNEGYITMSGTKATSWANGRCSDPIPVKKGDVVTVVSTANNSNVAIIALTDSTESFYTPILPYSGIDNDTYRYLCDADGYIIISGHKNYTMSAAISSVPINSFIMDYIVKHQVNTAVRYDAQSLTTGQKEQARTNIGSASSEDLTMQTGRIDGLTTQVANINTILDTLGMNAFVLVNSLPVASGSTEGKVYLVSDGEGEYNRYITVENDGEYSWVSIGTTDWDMSEYATKKDAINFNNVALVPRRVIPNLVASAKIDPAQWSADSDGAIDPALQYIWDESYQMKRPCVRGYNVNSRSKFYSALPSAIDMTDKAIAVSIYIREDIEESQLQQIQVRLYSNSTINSANMASVIVQQTYNSDYEGNYRAGWFQFSINAKECFESSYTGTSFDITNVTHIAVVPGGGTAITSNNDVYIADFSIYNPMRRGGVVLLIDNFAPSVADMWKYAASKGVNKMNLSIVPNWIGGANSATLAEIKAARDAGNLIINHTFNHKTTVVDNNKIADEIALAEDWMNRNGFARGSKIVSVPSSYFPTDKYKAYVKSNAQMIYHNWLPQTQEDNSISNPKYYVNYPYFPNTRFLNISGLDQNAWNQTRLEYCLETARRAIADKGYAVLGFHATAWDVDGGVLWKSFIDQLVALTDIYFFGLDEILEGEIY